MLHKPVAPLTHPHKFLQRRPKITLKLVLFNGKVQKRTTQKKRRAAAFLQAVPNSEVRFYFISVTYGYITDVFGKRVLAKNQGKYTHFEGAFSTLQTFTDPQEIRAILEG